MGVVRLRNRPPEGFQWLLDIADHVGKESHFGGSLPRGTLYVRLVGISMVTISDTDTTPLVRKRRIICWVRGKRVNTRWWFDDTEPTTGPIRKYPKIDLNYLKSKYRAGDPYQVSLRYWTDDS